MKQRRALRWGRLGRSIVVIVVEMNQAGGKAQLIEPRVLTRAGVRRGADSGRRRDPPAQKPPPLQKNAADPGQNGPLLLCGN